MDIGEILYISSRLFLGALAAFLAIMLWSKTRDMAWMLMVIGTIAAYAEIVYSILGLFGITQGTVPLVGSIPLPALILSNLPTGFLIAAFLVMVIRKFHR
ncbi:hypothetical protein [Treponema primitia]|uniref:hypothetical protein n=1 Tax=Treponema primitia TaxID=88058 RepID=UPI0002554D55|nr:hypothetical protein [Treponema primitia]